MQKYIKIHPADKVAVALCPLPAGTLARPITAAPAQRRGPPDDPPGEGSADRTDRTL